MTDQTDAALSGRITEYLSLGGYWNPESMPHDKVRDLLMECRDALDRRADQQPEADR